LRRLLSGAMLALLVVSMLASTFTIGTRKPKTTNVNDGTQKSNSYSQTLSDTPSTEWNRTYGGTGYDGASSLVQTADGGYALAGATAPSLGGSYDAWFVKVDASGNMLWNKTYGGTDYDWAYSVVQTTEGGYALAGTTMSFGDGSEDAWLVKTDAAGNMLWNKTYGGTGGDYAFWVVQTTEGGYALAGTTASFGAGGFDFWLIKTDAAGNMLWNKTYGGTDYDWASPVVQTADGGYALAGATTSFGAGGFDFWLVKTDSTGNMLWNRTYGGTGDDKAFALGPTSDGGYALAGYTVSFGAGSYDFWLVKTDAAGDMLWNKTYGGTGDDEADSLVQTTDGGYALAGETSSFGAGSYDFWLVKVAGASPTYDVTFAESGLAEGAQWTVTLDGLFVHDVHSATSNPITFVLIPNGVYDYSIAARGFEASPASGSITVNGAEVTVPILFSIIYVSTQWDSTKNSYSEPNFFSNYNKEGHSDANCFGMSSTSVLYFNHYALGDVTYPYFPSQSTSSSYTTDLKLDVQYAPITGNPSINKLNNASLAVTFHQVYGQDFSKLDATYLELPNEDLQYSDLLGNLTAGQPVVLMISAGPSDGWSHAVVAYGISQLSGGHTYGQVGIQIYDPNYPAEIRKAVYDLVTHSFSYDSGPKINNKVFVLFYVVNPVTMPPAIPNEFYYLNLDDWWKSWLQDSLPDYTIVFVRSKMAMVQDDDFKQDYFNQLGNSQTFVCGISGSSGIEEFGIQVYAIPDSVCSFKIEDPGSNQSLIMITHLSNDSGQLVGYGYLLNATTIQESLNYTVTPSGSGLSISTGDSSLNASIAFLSATDRGYSVSYVSNVTVNAMQTINFTAPCVMSVVPAENAVYQGSRLPINVTITNSAAYAETFNVTVCANETETGNSTVIATFKSVNVSAGNSTTLMLTWDTTGLSGNYDISACVASVIGEAGTVYDAYAGSTVTVQAISGGGGGRMPYMT